MNIRVWFEILKVKFFIILVCFNKVEYGIMLGRFFFIGIEKRRMFREACRKLYMSLIWDDEWVLGRKVEWRIDSVGRSRGE